MGKKICLALGVLLSVAAGQALAAPPSEQQVRKLMDVIGLGNSLNQMNTQVAASMRQALPCVSSHYWDSFIDDNSKQEFIGRLVPVYQKHFSADEVEGLIRFYSSSLGQKVLTEMPQAMAEANQAGQQWSHEHGQQMIEKLEQAGTLGENGRCPASAAPSDLAPAESSSTAAAAGDDDDDEAAAVPVPAHTAVHTGMGHRHGSGHVPAKKHVPSRKGASKGAASKGAASKGRAGKQAKSATSTKNKGVPAKKKTKPHGTSHASGQGS